MDIIIIIIVFILTLAHATSCEVFRAHCVAALITLTLSRSCKFKVEK